MSSSNVSTPSVSSSSERFTGRVKWFNNKAGYGFITVTDGSMSGSDVFVHHSSVKVDSEQYKYLVQGEYVDFVLSDTKTGTHEFQAGDVCGIKGGKLMCETRRESRVARSQYRSETSEPVKEPRAPTNRGGQPSREEKTNWTYVSKTRPPSETTTQNTSQKSAPKGRGRPPKASHNRL